MIFIITAVLLIIPFVIFLILVADKEYEPWFDYTNVWNIISLIILLSATLFIPGFLCKNRIFESITQGRLSYWDLEVLVLTLFINTVLSLILGNLVRDKDTTVTGKDTGIIILLTVVVMVHCIACFNISYKANRSIRVQEICRKQLDYSAEDDSENPVETSYIVLFNPNKYAVHFDKLYVSTDEDDLHENTIKDVFIPANSTYTAKYPYGEIDFSKKNKTTLLLSSNISNELIERVEIPALNENEIYVYDSSTDNWSVKKTDDIELNKTEVAVEIPVFSREGGFYDSDFDLTIEVPEGTTVYYTTDCTDPTEASTRYAGESIHVYDRSSEPNIYRAIRNVTRTYLEDEEEDDTPVDKCFVVRAVAIDKDGNHSKINTGSYFINLDKYKSRNVVSLVSDPDGLFNDDYGIYVTGRAYDEWYKENLEIIIKEKEDYNKQMEEATGIDEEREIKRKFLAERQKGPEENYNQHGMEWERETSFEFYQNGNTRLKQLVGIRIQGNSSRYGFKLKSLSIYSRKIYSGSNLFDETIINDNRQHSFVIKTPIRFNQIIGQKIGEGRNVLTASAIPVNLFLNGEYWYEGYLYEKFDETNIAEKYGLNRSNVVLVKNGEKNEVSNKGSVPYDILFSFPQQYDLSKPENYIKYTEMIDIQSYIDSCCLQTWLGNQDYQEKWNNIYWHTIILENKNFADMKWRMGLLDMDAIGGSVEWDPYQDSATYYDPITEWAIYSALRQNDGFCRQYVITMMDMINSNLSIDNIEAVLNSVGRDLSYLNGFFHDRTRYYLPMLEEEFALTGTREKVIVTSNIPYAGIITLNTIDDISKYSHNNVFTGEYYTDYPITLSVKPYSGQSFSHWEVDGEYYSDETDIELEVKNGGTKINAVFN